jgi:type VI secretion system protein ImpK
MNLSAFFVPLMAYVQGLDRQPAPDAQTIHEQLQRLIRQAREKALAREVTLERFHDALFPVVAWIDERLSVLPQWQDTRPWRPYMLQRKLFSTSLAGVQFFDRLEMIEPGDVELREVYVMCLALGFVGRFSQNPNSPQLVALRQSQYQILRPERPSDATSALSQLFPEAYRIVSGGKSRLRFRLGSRLAWQLVVIVPILAIGGLALWFDSLLSHQVAEIIRGLS